MIGKVCEKQPLMATSDEEQGYISYSVPVKDDDCSSTSSSLKTESSLPHSIELPDIEKQKYDQKKGYNGPFKSAIRHVDMNAFQFALRMAICLTISALFVLIRTPDWSYPDAMWVLVSVLFVCWFPALDAASVIEKVVQRLIGTFVGAVIGLSCGFFSIVVFKDNFKQSIFLGICIFVFNFLIIFFAGQCKVGELKVIQRFAYATILCVLTFCICILPFATDNNPKWERGVMRVINVIVGCAIGALGSIAVCPKSTSKVLFDKTARQVKMAGEASEAILMMSSDYFSGRIHVNRLADELLNTPLESEMKWKLRRSDTSFISVGSWSSTESTASMTIKESGATDVALKKYEDAISEWKLCKSLFPLAIYDPFHLSHQTEEAREFQTEIARTLARALRIQTTILVLDGMVRSDAEYMFSEKQLESFRIIGAGIKHMLHVPLNIDKSNDAAKILFTELDFIRGELRTLSKALATSKGEDDDFESEREQGLKDFKNSLFNKSTHLSMRTVGDDLGRGIPQNVTDGGDNTLFFLQLVEHLILRSLRLYQAWKHAEPTGRIIKN